MVFKHTECSGIIQAFHACDLGSIPSVCMQLLSTLGPVGSPSRHPCICIIFESGNCLNKLCITKPNRKKQNHKTQTMLQVSHSVLSDILLQFAPRFWTQLREHTSTTQPGRTFLFQCMHPRNLHCKNMQTVLIEQVSLRAPHEKKQAQGRPESGQHLLLMWFAAIWDDFRKIDHRRGDDAKANDRKQGSPT